MNIIKELEKLMELEEFIEEHIECTSNWVHSCAQYALRNFTHEVAPEDADDDTVRDGRTVDDYHRDENGSFFVDLRLRYHNGELYNHSGSTDFDQDHRGYSSASSVEWCATKEQAHKIAKYMLTDLFNNIPEGE
jgi:hypothetical protein